MLKYKDLIWIQYTVFVNPTDFKLKILTDVD